MGKKRKRPVKDGQTRPAGLSQPSSSTTAPETAVGSGNNEAVSKISGDSSRLLSHPVLSLYYNRVVSLRQYLLGQIPVASRSRRRRIASIGCRTTGGSQVGSNSSNSSSNSDNNGLAAFLDTTLVGVLKETPPTISRERQRDLVAFSQSQSQSKSQLSTSDSGSSCAQAEIVDFVITVLFNRNGISYRKPQHLLTHGYQRATAFLPPGNNTAPACSIPGLVARFPNQNVVALKQAPWTEVLGLLGSNGDEIMLRLLLDCGVFVSIDTWKGIYNQVSGLPLSDLDPVEKQTEANEVVNPGLQGDAAPAATGKQPPTAKTSKAAPVSPVQRPNSVVFLRRRMLYARPKLTSKGKIDSGLTSLHVLNRYQNTDSLEETVHILKYIFPRQFGLHNVFTSHVGRETALPFTDYSAREDEIARLENQKQIRNPRLKLNSVCEEGHSAESPPKVPKRLRGEAVALAQQMRNRHKRCSYLHLLNYYCPEEVCLKPCFLRLRLTYSGDRPMVSRACQLPRQ
ncbi:hypothetical protein P168DRAFT_60658 [Aspergillus campestris IBT 28561]|uniref:Telomerase reverse transcriptase n=1 Tax=Aspergillus campestris (strain IBT 28561) TaxID=1392248 RepID=A0A2I1CUE4_ASPC2|nr:uncharacterized protein P168DRAFT_60658 [Aspergillus campestris IBT 28561]PKY01234.1 hypothetical protein P168DRAFT_60658 [Aspergillus campestris IBT 28561]